MDCPVCLASNPGNAVICTSCGSALFDESSGGGSATSLLHLQPNTPLKQNKYRVEKTLGEGGFGITYKGIDLSSSKEVAIKELLPDRSSRKGTAFIWSPSVKPQEKREQLYKFKIEAEYLSKCNHPNIVQVFDWFEENDTAYIVMEFAKGEPLSSVLKREKLISESRVKVYLLQIADALKAVHANGLLHRDIKPDNIILNQQDKPILIDFGNAREFIAGKTQKMTNVGTPEYAPLEQNSSTGKFAPPIDIYALLATVYELLTGKLPDMATDRAMALAKSKPDTLIPPSRFASVSPLMDQVVITGLKLNSEERFQTAEELIDALNGKFISPKLKQARELVSQNNLSAAVLAYDKCLNSEPHNGEAAIELAQVQIYLDDAQAEIAAQKAIQLKSTDSRGFGVLGLVQCRKGNWNEAVKSLQQSVNLSPQLGWMYANFAWALGKIGNWQKAEESVSKSLQLDSENPFTLGLQAWITGNRQDWKPAIRSARQAMYKAKQVNYPNLQKLQEWVYPCLILALERAVVTKQAGDVERCLQEYTNQVPNSSFAWGYTGWQQARQQMFAEASSNLDESVRKSGVPMWALCDRAIVYEMMQNIPKAQQAYEAAVQVYPNDAFSAFRLGTILAQQGEWLRAKPYLEQAIQIRSDYPEAHHNLGWVLLNIQKQDPQSKQIRQLRSAYSKASELYALKQNPFSESIKRTFSAIGINL